VPSRLLREGILTSERIDQLDATAEVFYRRLMSKVDDFGLFDARPAILRSSLFPLRVDRVREADIARWIAACEMAGVIALYSHAGKPYGQMVDTGWQTRSEPKHPLPPWGKEQAPRTGENKCEQPQTPVPVFGVVVGDGDVPPVRWRSGDGFEEFYTAYPKKKKRPEALKAWDKLKPDAELRKRMLRAVSEQRKTPQWQKDGGQFIPYPASWLNAEGWNDSTEVQLLASESSGVQESNELLDRMKRDAEAARSPEALRAKELALASMKRIGVAQ
jgi:hypothetical protein